MSEVIKHTPKLWERRSETKSFFLFWCQGCGRGHIYWVGSGFTHPQQWSFNGNYERPSFGPSLRMYDDQGTECHLFVTDGEVRYCGGRQLKLRLQT